jgi:hypothetical protein
MAAGTMAVTGPIAATGPITTGSIFAVL